MHDTLTQPRTLIHLLGGMIARVPRWLRWLVLAGGAGSGLLLVWGVGIEPRLVFVEDHTVTIPRLPEEWKGRRIALIADPQVGIWLSNTDTVRRIVARLVEIRPVAVLIAGDFIYQPLKDEPEDVREAFAHRDFKKKPLDELRTVADLLRPLHEAGIPTYAVLGNHDYGLTSITDESVGWLARQVREQLQSIGIRVLQNEAVQLPRPGDGSARSAPSDLWLVGFGPEIPNEASIGAALAEVPPDAPRLVLMHNPDTFAKLPAQSAPLAMAGHTHGGQIRLPWLALRRLLGRVNQARPDMSGWIDDYGERGNRLYINRGIGFSRLPIRINSPPEITVFTLRARE